MFAADFGSNFVPALQTLYQYIKYPGVIDLNKLYGLKLVPSKLNTACKILGAGLLLLNIGISGISNFKNDNLTIGNLETSITIAGTKWPDKQYNFRSDPKNLKAMKEAGVDYTYNSVYELTYTAVKKMLK